MNDTVFFVCPDLKKKKKKDRPTDPPNFQAKRANNLLFFWPNPVSNKHSFCFSTYELGV